MTDNSSAINRKTVTSLCGPDCQFRGRYQIIPREYRFVCMMYVVFWLCALALEGRE